jgi:choline dehydrogenase-like flavoprotein
VLSDLREQETGSSLSVDVCVVGGGPAGITVANELIGSGLKVCLVESGGEVDEPDTQALYEGESIGHLVTMDEGRYRIFGGSATRWSGRCAILDPIDFEERDWIRNSGWPIGSSTLAPYYERAKTAAQFQKPWIPDDQVPSALGFELPRFSTPGLKPYVWRYAPQGFRRFPDWAKLYGHRLKADPHTHVLLHANLTAIAGADDGSTIDSIDVTSSTNVSMKIKARAFVLCCGGMENVRLLLNAPREILRKVDESSKLGRYFAQHPRGLTATLRPTPEAAKRLQNLFRVFTRRSGVQYEIGFALSEEAQRRHRLLNASAAVYYEASSDSSWKAATNLAAAVRERKLYSGIHRDLVPAMGAAANLARRLLQGSPPLLKDPLITIIVDVEQEPNAESRVTLSDQLDAFGMRRAKVDWRISEIERTTARHLNGLVGEELHKLGFGRTENAAWLTRDTPVREGELYGTYHHIGTTRMSRHPPDGVTNENCRAHGVTNLYFGGCSVFPTGGHANPTLSIVALSIRLADHLRSHLRH